MNNVIKVNEIGMIYANKVGSEFTGKGMRILVNTMSGSQGEVAKIDCTDGKNIYRILVESFSEPIKDEEKYSWDELEGYRIVVLRYDYNKRFESRFDSMCTLWRNDGEVIEEIKFYDLSGWSRKRQAYTMDREEAIAGQSRRSNRATERYRSERNDSKEIELTRERRNKLCRIAKERRGYGSITRKMITGLEKRSGAFYIKVEGKKDLRISL